MGALKKEENSTRKVVKEDNKIKYTAKGNRLIEFMTVSDEERKRLKIDAYEYIL